MTIKLNTKETSFKLSEALKTILEKYLPTKPMEESVKEIVIVFKDENYSLESGGYHPVEIRMVLEGNDWLIDYITDFCLVSNGYSGGELVKEIDFDFTNEIGYQIYTGEFPLKTFYELFEIWQSNFVSYYEMGVFKTNLNVS